MAISVNFYQFNKKENSTTRPAGSGVSFNCVLKDRCTIETPEIELNVKPNQWYNYCYIPDFQRYYFVSNWNYFRGIWTATLKVDTLATYKSEIGNTTKYILRSASEYDKEIKDTLYPLKSETVKTVETGSLWNWASSFAGGTYIAYVNNGKLDNSSFGSLNYMYFTPAQFGQLLTCLYPQSNDSWGTTFFTQAYNVIAGALLNPIDFITKVIWIPISLPEQHLKPTNFGNYTAVYNNNIMVEHGNLESFRRTQTVNITVPKRPDVIRGEWANTEPFGKYYIYYAPFGIISLDSQMLIGAVSIDVVATLDLTTGDLKLRIYTLSPSGAVKDTIYSGTSRVGIEIPVDKAKSELIQNFDTLLGVGSIAVDSALGNYVGLANDVAGSIGSMKEAPMKSGGSTRGLLALEDTIYLYYEYAEFAEEDNTNKGRPLCQNKQINTLSGFMICNNGLIEIPGTSEEQQEIKKYLEGGFYYE